MMTTAGPTATMTFEECWQQFVRLVRAAKQVGTEQLQVALQFRGGDDTDARKLSMLKAAFMKTRGAPYAALRLDAPIECYITISPPDAGEEMVLLWTSEPTRFRPGPENDCLRVTLKFVQSVEQAVEILGLKRKARLDGLMAFASDLQLDTARLTALVMAEYDTQGFHDSAKYAAIMEAVGRVERQSRLMFDYMQGGSEASEHLTPVGRFGNGQRKGSSM